MFEKKIQTNDEANKLIKENQFEKESFREVFCSFIQQNPEKLKSVMTNEENDLFEEFKKQDDIEFTYKIKDIYIDEYLNYLSKNNSNIQENDVEMLS